MDSQASNKIILSLAGWAQKPSSLDSLLLASFPNHKIINFDYTKFSSIDECFSAFKELKINPEIIVGWSLGGQIAARLISEKIFNPKLLVLLAAPFQFVKSPKIAAGMPESSYKSFKENFATSGIETLKNFSLLMMLGSQTRAKELADNLHLNEDNHQNLLFWLDELKRFSCFEIDFSDFPKTLILHGDGDMVVNILQAKVFAEKILNSHLKILANCGHCPHISNFEEAKNFLTNESNDG